MLGTVMENAIKPDRLCIDNKGGHLPDIIIKIMKESKHFKFPLNCLFYFDSCFTNTVASAEI